MIFMLIDLEKHYYIVNNINGEKLRSMVEDKIDQCNIVLDEALRTGDDNLYSKTLSESHAFFQVLRMIFDLSLEVDKVQTEDKAEPEEVPAQTEDKFSIYCFYEDGYRVAFPVRDNFYNYGLILHMYSNRFEFSNSELYSSTVLNVFNLDNDIHGDILSICICPTVFDPKYTCYYCPPDIDYDEIPF